MQTKTQGFSLLEMLTVLTVVGITAVVLSSALGAVRESAMRATCASNMRQIGMALHLYAHERNGDLPKTMHFHRSHEAWIHTLAPYYGNVDEIRVSPADPNARERLKNGGTSYILNDLVFNSGAPLMPWEEPRPAYDNLLRIPRPEATILAFPSGGNRGFTAADDHTHAANWLGWNQMLADIAPDLHGGPGQGTEGRARGGAHYLYADSGVSYLQAEEMKAMIAQGVNPAAIPGTE